MKIYTLVALAVFGSICFSSGVFLGQHTYYDEKSLDLLKQGYMDYLDNASESQKLGSDLMLIDLLQKCENEDCSGVIEEVLKPQLKEVIDKFENGGFKGFQHMLIKSDIEKAKKLLAAET